MRRLWVVAVAVALAGCGAYQFPGGSTSPDASGTVQGTVLSVPCAPVERVDSPCAGRAVGGLAISFVKDGAVAAKAVTDSSGRYSVRLPAGTYAVKLDTYMRLVSGPSSVTVTAGSTTRADYVLDNGIRAPVPQQ